MFNTSKTLELTQLNIYSLKWKHNSNQIPPHQAQPNRTEQDSKQALKNNSLQLADYKELEDMARYTGLLLAPGEGFGLWPRAFFALREKKGLIMLFRPIFGNFLCPVVTLVTFSSNLSNFERNPKKPK